MCRAQTDADVHPGRAARHTEPREQACKSDPHDQMGQRVGHRGCKETLKQQDVLCPDCTDVTWSVHGQSHQPVCWKCVDFIVS